MIRAGDTSSWERTFTVDDVRAFAALSGDRGRHHVEPDASGRLMVHGLLTASLPTKLGGDIGFIARQLDFEFVRPVFTGEPVRCEMRIDEVVQDKPGRTKLAGTARCTNAHGEEVLRVRYRGVVLDGAG